MSIYFSVSTKGFYSHALHTHIPPDAVEITEQQYLDLLAGQTAGKEISADADGNPILIDPPSANGGGPS